MSFHTITIFVVLILCATFGRAGGANLAFDLSWNARTDWLSNPASDYRVEKQEGLIRFTIGQSGRGMKWSAEFPQVIDLAKTPWLVIRYRAKNATAPQGYLVWLHGTQGEEQFVVEPADFLPDGEWHTLVVRANPFLANMVAIQLQSARSGSYIEVARMEFVADAPKLNLDEILPTGKPIPGKFKVIDISSVCNSGIDVLLQTFNLRERSTKGELVASGVPFALGSGSRAIVALPADKPCDSHIPLKGASGTELFLLIAATSKDGNKLPPINEPHLFSLRILYSTGLADEVVPRRLPTGDCLSGGIAVYSVPLIQGKPIKEVVIHDNAAGASIYLMGMTLGISTQIGLRPTPLCEPKPYVASSMPSGEWAVHQSDTGDTLDFFDGKNHLHLSLDGITMSTNSEGSGVETSGSLWRIHLGSETLESSDFSGVLVESRHPYYTIELGDKRGVGISGTLNIIAESASRILMQLQLGAKEKCRIQVEFPFVPSICHKTADLSYCFPRRGAVINNIPISLREPYSGLMPLQFMDVYGPSGGMYLLTQDRDAVYKYFNITKNEANRVSLSVEYLEQEVGRGAPFQSAVTEIGFHSGDWHTALDAYKKWLRTWYKADAPRKDWFRRVFNFRQQFLRFYVPGGEHYYNKETKEYTFEKGIAEDVKAFGAVDYLHLFDWGASEKWGRTGDYDPWEEIGGVDAFRAAVEKTQALGIPVGLYIEGYLIDPQSRIAQSHGKDWQILDKEGKPLPFFAPSLNMCSAVKEWQDYLASVYSRVKEQTHAMGYYCDEMGFADPAHFCYAPGHGHPVPEPPLRGQRDLLAKIRSAIGPDVALYTEETPADSVTRHIDGSFTYSISSVSDQWSPSHVNLTRFAIPDFKTFEIIVCDQPLGNRLTAARQIFFNGEGIWLEGPADKWFAPEVLSFIRRMHSVMRKYEDCFLSVDVLPLVPTAQRLVFANMFTAKKRTLWTLFNANYSTVRGELLAIEHTPGVKYYDAWNHKEIKPRISGKTAYLTLSIGPRDVGCVVAESP